MVKKEGKSSVEQRRYWIGVVSASHVRKGVLDGFAQLCHGKAAPLRRMSADDWLIYYSPRTDLIKGSHSKHSRLLDRLPMKQFTNIR